MNAEFVDDNLIAWLVSEIIVNLVPMVLVFKGSGVHHNI
jgi:hypothetical protein